MKQRTHWLMAMALPVAAVVTLTVAAGRPRAEEGHSASGVTAPGMGVVSMSSFYTGDGQIGTFPGTLVCLRCDLTHAPGGAAQCEKEGHRHALSMDDGSMVHPLLAGTEQTQERINSSELHGKKVKVTGKYYPSTGFILVSEIVPAG